MHYQNDFSAQNQGKIHQGSDDLSSDRCGCSPRNAASIVCFIQNTFILGIPKDINTGHSMYKCEH